MTDPKQPNVEEDFEEQEDHQEPGSLFDDPTSNEEDREDPDYEPEVFPNGIDSDDIVDWGNND